jgi:hypothetical protein
MDHGLRVCVRQSTTIPTVMSLSKVVTCRPDAPSAPGTPAKSPVPAMMIVKFYSGLPWFFGSL